MWWVVGGGVGSRCSVVGGGWWVGMRALPLIGGGEGAGGFVHVHSLPFSEKYQLLARGYYEGYRALHFPWPYNS